MRSASLYRRKSWPVCVCGVAEEFEAVGLGAGERVLVAEDDAGGILLELAGTDEAAARESLLRSRHGVLLRVGVEAGARVWDDDLFADPALQSGGRAGVDVFFVGRASRRVAGEDAALFDGDQVVRVGGVILVLHGRGDFVVRLGEDEVVSDFASVVAVGGKRVDLSHVKILR